MLDSPEFRQARANLDRQTGMPPAGVPAEDNKFAQLVAQVTKAGVQGPAATLAGMDPYKALANAAGGFHQLLGGSASDANRTRRDVYALPFAMWGMGVAPPMPAMRAPTVKGLASAKKVPKLPKAPPKVANRYVAGTPVTKFDKAKGKTYTGKASPPKAWQKAYDYADKQVKAGNYEPYFDVSKRADVEGYGPFNRATMGVRKKTPAAIKKWEALANDPQAKKNLVRMFEEGLSNPDAHGFYKMRQIEQLYIDELGPTAGRQGFIDLIDSLAATTAGQRPSQNFKLAHYAQYLREQGKRVPPSYQQPAGVPDYKGGGRTFNRLINEGQGFDPNINPKPHEFRQAFLGDVDAFVNDKRMSSAWPNPLPYSKGNTASHSPRMTMPPKGTYGHYEGAARSAIPPGVQPRKFQEVGWGNVGATKPMVQEINESIARTAMMTRLPQDYIARHNFIRKEGPMWGLTGAAIGGPTLYGSLIEDANAKTQSQ